jgi:hypothetical protein
LSPRVLCLARPLLISRSGAAPCFISRIKSILSGGARAPPRSALNTSVTRLYKRLSVEVGRLVVFKFVYWSLIGSPYLPRFVPPVAAPPHRIAPTLCALALSHPAAFSHRSAIPPLALWTRWAMIDAILCRRAGPAWIR